MTDKELLDEYWLGWKAAGWGDVEIYEEDSEAFKLGYIDFIAGDDQTQFDYQSEEQILKRIKSETK